MSVRALSVRLVALLLAAQACTGHASVLAPPAASMCLEWRIQPTVPKAGAAKAVVGMADLGNLTVIDFAGSYARDEALPRQEIAQAFLQGRADDYDFLIVFTTFEFETGEALAFYNALRNDVRGIALPLFDNGAAYGSARRLQGIVDMAAVSRYAFDSGDPRHPELLNTLAHELMHRWAVRVRFRTPGGSDSSDLIGRDGSHWSNFVDSDGSVMYGNDWQPLPGGRFRSVRVRHQYSPLDRYLGGFLASGEVPPTILLRGAAGEATSLPQLGAEVGATAESVSINQIIAAEGARDPSAADSPKAFRAGVLLLKRPGEAVPAGLLGQMERLRANFQQRFTVMTGGRGTLRMGNLPRQGAAPGLPQIVQPSALRGDDAQIQAGLDWLRGRQQTDGRFEDDPATVLRDTAYAVMALAELASGDAAIARARAYLFSTSAVTLEDYAWRAAGLPGDRAVSVAAIEGLRGAEGFRLAAGLEPGVLDTQVAVELLGREDPTPARWQWYVDTSEAWQGGDGGFGAYPRGAGSIRSTAFAIANLARVDPLGTRSASVRNRGRGWLLARQAADGAFGNSLSESLDVFARQPLIALPETPYVRLRGWVRGRQGVAGDFGGSVFSTSLALLALSRDGAPNLAITGTLRFDPPQPVEGNVVRVLAIVENRGGGAAPASVARFFDGPPGAGGAPIGGPIAVPALEVGGRSTAVALLDTRGLAGERTIHAVVDAANDVAESSEADNESSATLMVALAPAAVELALAATELTVTPPRIQRAPVEVVVAGVLRNLGGTAATQVLVRATIDGASQEPLAETRVDVTARANAPFELRFTRESAAGFRLRIEADADARFAEADEANNVLLREVPAGEGVDLVVPIASVELLGGANAVAGRLSRFRVAVENRGASDSPPAVLEAAVDFAGGRIALPVQTLQVAAGGRETREFVWTPPGSGPATLAVQVDPAGAIAELDEGNNSASLDFAVIADSGVNLAIQEARVELEPATPREAAPLLARVRVINLGAAAAPPTIAALYAGDPRLAGRELARILVPGIPAGGNIPVELAVAALTLRGDTTFYVAIDADGTVAETNETDNFALRTVPVLGLADLSIALADIELEPSRPVVGETVTATLRVRNLGQLPAGSFAVRLSELGGIAAPVAPERNVDALAPGAVAQLQWTWTLGQGATPDALRVEVDSGAAVAETREDNNRLELPLSLQDGSVFASQRWFSPNGDGVRDSVRVVWRLPAAEPIEVGVRNAGGRMVRRFPVALIARGEIVWDGRNDRGRVVPDGDYRIEVRGTAGRLVGMLDATVDTNRSTAVEAIDTPRARLVALPSTTSPGAGGWRFGPRGAATRFAVFALAARPPPGVSPPRFVGLYRSDTLFPALQPVLSQEWVQRYAAARGYYAGEVVDFWLLPDGQRIAFQLRMEISFGPYHYVFGTTRADVVDNPTLLGTPQVFPGSGAPFVEAVLDEQTIVVRWPVAGGFERRLFDLRSGVGTAFATDLSPDNEVVRAISGGVVFRRVEGGDQRWRFAPRIGGASRDLGIWRGAVLSPDGRALAGIREAGSSQSVWLAPLDGTPFRQLASVDRSPFAFAPNDQRYPDQLTMSWIARAGELLVIDAEGQRALAFSSAGEALDAVDLNIEHDPLEPLDPGTLWIGSANSVHLGRTAMPTQGRCEGAATWLAERPLYQWFDAANEELSLTIGRTIAVRRPDGESGELVAELLESGQRLLDLDLFAGVAIPGSGVVPAWMFADGSRIGCNGSLWSAGGERLRERWDLADSVGDVSPDESTLMLSPAIGAAGAQTGGRVLGSFLNLPVVLRAENVGRAIRLYGLVADRQFERWELDWSTPQAPTLWQSVTAPSDAEVLLDDFLYWTPPEPGTYLVRLRAFDRAGNVESATIQVVSQFAADLGRVSAAPRALSPNGDGVQDDARIDYEVRRPTTVRIEIRDATGTALRTFLRVVGESELGPASWTWDGRGDGGTVVPDGRYVLWINEQRFPLLVDTQAPTGAPLLRTPFAASGGRVATLQLAPQGRSPVQDANLARLALEHLDISGWRVLREAPLSRQPLEVALEDYTGRTFRLRAIDLAGNQSLFPLGEAVEELTLVARTGLWRAAPGSNRARAEQSSVGGNTPPFDAPPELGTRFLLPNPPDLDLLEVSTTARDLIEIEYQTAALATVPDWQVRSRVAMDAGGTAACSRIGITVAGCPLTQVPAHWQYVDVAADPASLAEGRAFLARVVGRRIDGSRLASNWIRFDSGPRFELACAAAPAGANSLIPGSVRERLLAEAGLAPDEVSGAMRFAGFDLPPPDGLRSLERIDIGPILNAATILAVERGGALVQLSPAALAQIRSAESEGRKALAVARPATLVEGARAVATEARSCALPGAVVASMRAKVKPLLGAECADTPSGGVQLLLGTISAGATATVRRIVVVFRDPVTGAQQPALDRSYAPAIVIDYIERNPRTLDLDTTALAPGAAEVLISVDRGQGLEPLAPAPFVVDRTPGSAAIFEPAAGARICATRAQPGQPLSVPLAGAVDGGDSGQTWRRHGVGEGATPLAWREGREIEGGPVNGPLGVVSIESAGGLLPPLINGTATLRVRAWDWSGAQVCARQTMFVDSMLEVEEGPNELPGPVIETTSLGAVLGLSGRGRFQRITLPYRLGERVDFTLTLHGLAQAGVAGSALLDPPLATVQDGFAEPPALRLTWDGSLGGSPLGEGLYGLRLQIRDACGFSKRFEYRLRVDRTPPTVALTQPSSGAVVGGLQVEIRGAVDDPRLAHWQVLAGSSAPGSVLAPVDEGTAPVSPPARLAQWQRGSLAGAATIALVAEDMLDNIARVDVPIMLAAPSQLVTSGSVAPPLFSPDGDGVRDTTRLEVVLARAVRATVRVVDDGGALQRVLASEVPLSAGASNWTWDGRAGGSTAVADGAYRIELQVVDAAQPASSETQIFAVAVDTAPPVLQPLPDAAAFVAAGRAIGVSIAEPRLESYQVALRRETDGVELTRSAGTDAVDVVLSTSDALEEIAYRLVGSASDRAGNSARLDHRFVVDRTAPALEIASPADGAVLRRNGTVTVAGAADDANLDRWELRLERTGFIAVVLATGQAAVAAGGSIHAWPVQQADGEVRLVLTATDRAGNSARAERPVVIDGTPPVAVLTRPVTGAAIRSELRVEGTATDANFLGYRIALAPANGAVAGQFSDLFDGEAPVILGPLFDAVLSRPEGEYLLRVTVEDRAGQASTATVALRIDTEPPAAPTGLVATPVDNRDVALDWSDVAASDLAGYRIYRNGVPLATEPIQSAFRDALAPEGRLRYAVSAIDRAGNESPRSAPADVILDRTPPTVLLAQPLDAANVAGVVGVRGSVLAAADLSSWRLTATAIAGGAASVLAEGAQERDDAVLVEWDTRALPDLSAHRLRLEAVDRSGNLANVQAQVVVDNGPPSAPTGLVSAATGNDVSLDWAANTETDLLGYLVYRNGVLLTATGAPPQDLRPYAISADSWIDEDVGDGTLRYRVRAIDRAGNVSEPSTEAVVELDNTPPRLSLVEPLPEQRFDRTIRLRAQSRDVDIVQVVFARRSPGGAWAPIGAPLTVPPWTVEWTPQGLPYGNYELRALARDAGGREDSQPPVVTVRFADLTPPEPPTQVRARADGLRIRTSWLASPSTDVALYRVYRDYGAGGNPLAELPSTARDHEDDAQGSYDVLRTVVAVDAEGNVSAAPPAAQARIFTPQLAEPFTPVAVASTALEGRSLAGGAARVTVTSSAGTAEIGPTVTLADGRFIFSGLPLGAGENRLEVRVTDTDGNRSIPAETFVDRALPPGAPEGVSVTLVERTASVAWTPRPVGEAIGYRVFRNGAPLLGDGDIAALTATSPHLFQTSRAIDNDPQTAVEVPPGFDGRFESPLVIELRAPAVENVVGLRLTAADGTRRIMDAEVEAWSGRRWVRVGGFTGNADVQRFVPFDSVYRTQRVRLLLHRVPPLTGGAIAELDLVRRPTVAQPPVEQVLPDGRHQFRVAAVERFAFEGPGTDAAAVDVGDATPPEPVVLVGVVSGSDAVLEWTASPAADVAAYLVYRDGSSVARVSAAAQRRYVDAYRPNGDFDYSVVAVDAFDNASAPSNIVRLTFEAELPGAPQWVSLQALPEGRAVQLQWQRGAGDVPADYVLERADAAAGPFAAIATQATNSFRDAPLVDGRTYFFRVLARDRAGNRGAPGEVRSVIPRDATAPVPPLLNLPSPPGGAYTTGATTVGVCGSAEADSRIDLRSDRGAAAQTRATAEWTVRSITSGVQTGLSNAAAPDGRLLLVSEFGRGSEIHDLDTGRLINRWPVSTQLATVSADARTLWYTDLSTPVIRRLDLATLASSVESENFDYVSVLLAAPDGRHLFAFARRTGQAAEAAWLLDTRGGEPRLLAEIDSPSVLGRFQWSPDGTRLLFLTAGASMAIAFGLDGSRQETPIPANALAAQWLPDGRSVLVLERAGPGTRLREVELGSGTIADRLEFPLEVDAFAVDPTGRYVVLRSAQRLDVVELATGVILITEPSGEIVAWTRGHRLLVLRDGVRVLDTPGGFCVRAFPLLAGTQSIRASARDAADNLGALSAPITVTVEAGELPDLAIGPADLRAVPAGGRVGEVFAAVVTVRNRGLAAAPSAPVSLRLTSPSGVVRALAPQASGALPAASARTLEFPLGVLDAAGTWVLRASVDGANAIVEVDESNNAAQRTIAVSAAGAPLLELALRGDLLAPGVPLEATLSLSNPGSRFDGALQAAVVDEGGDMVAEVLDLPVVALAFAQRRDFDIAWPTTGRAGGTYRLRATLRGAAGAPVATAEVPFAIDAWRVLWLDLAAPAGPIVRGAPLSARARIEYRSGNDVLADAMLHLDAVADNGATVSTTVRALGTLRPGFEAVVPFEVPTAAAALGPLRLVARVVSGSFESVAERTVAIVDSASPAALAGWLDLQPDAAVQLGRDAVLRWIVRNAGGAALPQVDVRLRVLAADGAALLTRTASDALAPGATAVRSEDLAATTLALGVYRAVLEARLPIDPAGTWRLLAARSLPVTDGEPPAIDQIEPDGSRPVAPPVRLRARVVDRHAGLEAVEAQIDSGNWIAMFGGVDGRFIRESPPLGDGAHAFRLRATDRHGNRVELPERPFVVDGMPPVIAIGGVIEGQIGSQDVVPTIAVTDMHPDPTQDVRSVDGQPYVAGAPIVAEGAHVLFVRAIDRAGNRTERTLRFTIDRSPPPLQFLAPTDGTATTAATVDVRLNTEAGARVVLQVGAYVAEAFAAPSGEVVFGSVPLQLGSNLLRARASDTAANQSPERTITLLRNDVGNGTLLGTLQVAPEVDRGATLAVAVQLGNQTGGALVQQRFRLRVFGPGGSPLLDSREFVRDLAAGATANEALARATGAGPLGQSTLLLDAQIAGSWQQLSAAVIQVVDGTAPLLAVLSPAVDAVLRNPVRVEANASDPGSPPPGLRARIDLGPWLDLVRDPGDASRFTRNLLPLAERSYRLDVEARDDAGNVTTAAPRIFAVDESPPVIGFGGVADGAVSNAANVVPTVSVVDLHPGTLTTTLDGLPWISGTPVAVEGEHRIDAVAVDRAGNQATAILRFTLDRTPPAVQLLAPPDGAVVALDRVTVLGQTDALANVRVANGAYSVLLVAGADGAFSAPDVPLALGVNAITAQATDRAGNVGALATRNVRYAPNAGATLEATLAVTPLDGEPGATPRANWILRNPGPSAIVALPVRLSFQRVAAGTPAVVQNLSVSLAPGASMPGSADLDTTGRALGAYEAVIEAQLTAGDGSLAWAHIATAPYAVVDRTAPQVAFLAPAMSSVHGTAVSVQVEAVDALSAIAQVEARLSGGPWLILAPVQNAPGRFAGNLDSLADGPSMLEARATDAAGQMGSAVPRAVTIDRVPPNIVIGGVPPEDPPVNTPVQPTITVQDATTVQAVVTLDAQPYVQGTPVTADGAHVLRVLATDAAGNASEAEARFTIDRTAPVVTITQPPPGTQTPQPTILVAGQTEPRATVRVAIGASQQEVVADIKGAFAVADVPLSIGSNSITASARDRAGNQGALTSVTVVRIGPPAAQFEGRIDLLAKIWEAGEPLPVPASLRNTGSTAATAARFRLLVQTVEGGALVASALATADVAAGATILRQFDFATIAWPQTELRLVLQHDRGGSGAPDWVMLDDHLLALDGSCFQARLFADGFESGAPARMFGDGFEPCVGVSLQPRAATVSAAAASRALPSVAPPRYPPPAPSPWLPPHHAVAMLGPRMPAPPLAVVATQWTTILQRTGPNTERRT